MSFEDPLVMTVNTVAQSQPRIGSSDKAGTFSTADGAFKTEISHTRGNSRTRSVIKLSQSKITTDPYASERNIPVGMSAYLVVDVPKVGFSAAEAKYVVDALVDYLDAASGAKVTKLIGGEQ